MKSLLSDFLTIIFGEPEDDTGYSWTHILLTLGAVVEKKTNKETKAVFDSLQQVNYIKDSLTKVGTKNIKARIDKKFKKIDGQTEYVERTNGWSNYDHIDLYVPLGKMDVSLLSKLCSLKKSKFQGTLYQLVIFDNESNAKRPPGSLSTGYYHDEKSKRHIIAAYSHHKPMNTSELFVWSPNMYQERYGGSVRMIAIH